jgi:hypothetical protein
MKLNMFRTTHRPSSGAQNCTSSLWFCKRERLLDVWLLDAALAEHALLVQFWAPYDGRCVARNMLSFI